jgi:tetratricopeptide (TPR) repeat protein
VADRLSSNPDVTSRSPNPSFAGEHVALSGKLSVLSRRDVRALVERLGGVFTPEVTAGTSVLVTAGDPAGVPASVRRVMSEDDLCRAAGWPDLETLRTRYYGARDLRAMYPALGDDHLRFLERWGVIRSVAGRYSFQDLHLIKQAVAALERGLTMNGLIRDLEAERQGQLALDFQPSRADRTPAKVVALPRAIHPPASLFPTERTEEVAAANQAMAAKYFLDGAELDDGENRDLDAAAAAYRRAALFDPQLVPAVVNLANIHYERDELPEAEALYEKAIRLDAECFEAYFNLGNIHHDLGRYKEALLAYRDALAINPAYPEAHFYLAVTLEKLGRSAEARPHWRQYRELAPEGEFVSLAKEFSESKD